MKRILPLILILLVSSGCAHGYRFKDAAPVTQAPDTQASPVPDKTGGEFRYVEYAVSGSLRYPVDSYLDTRRVPRSLDVNSMDEVPASAWFTPRLGYKNISNEELVKGPEKQGPPQKPLTITKAKTAGNSPGFIVKDARGIKYLIKFDRTEFGGIESTVNYVVNRLFWAFGYNVPEDYIFHLSPEDAKLGEGITQDEVDEVYSFSHVDEDGTYRTVASLFLQGKILGPISPKGTRKNDPNDTIRHENRRTLRGLRMFSAYLDNSGFRSDNSMDVYEGEPGQGHTVHYLLDFGEAFGAHGLEHDRLWDGYEHFFSLEDSLKKFAAFGLRVENWENLTVDSKSWTGNFEAETYSPGKWKETTQFLPIRYSKADDDYWAAKILLALKPEQVKALFDHADHADEDYEKSVLEILERRREKTIRYAFSRVSPLEVEKLENTSLKLKDLGSEIGMTGSEYRVKFLNASGKRVAPGITVPGGSSLEIPLSQALQASKGYLRVDVTAVQGGKPAPSAAQFHIRQSGSGEPKLAGVVH